MTNTLDKTRLDLAKLFKGIGVEVGVAEGWYSSKIMELGQVDRMWGVDPYKPHRGYWDYTRAQTFAKLRAKAHERLDCYQNYHFIEGFSADVAKGFDNNFFDFVYIDGDHSYEAVTRDITEWMKKLKPGGVIAGDDYIKSDRDKRYYDVIRAVDDYVVRHNIPLTLYVGGRNPTNWMFYK